jgi:hypothetical protein
MTTLVKTPTGKKFHVANGAYIYCGISDWESGKPFTSVSGDVHKRDICARCTNGMDPSQFGIEGVNILGGVE